MNISLQILGKYPFSKVANSTLKKKTQQEAFRERRHLHALWPLTLTCDLHLISRSRKLMSLDIAYCLGTIYDVCECNSLWDMTINSFLWPLTFTCDLQRMSRSLSFKSVDVPYVVVHCYQVWSLYNCRFNRIWNMANCMQKT